MILKHCDVVEIFVKLKVKLIFSYRDQLVIQLNTWNPDRHPKPANPRVRARNRAIVGMVLDYENPQRTRLDYLRGLAHLNNLAVTRDR